MTLFNSTELAAIDFPTVDQSGRDVVAVIVKETFEVLDDGRVVRAEEASPIRPGDIPYSEDLTASLKYPCDLCWEKRGTDVVVIGDAIAKSPVTVMDVAVKIRNVTAPLRVHGERLFYKSALSARIGPAAPFERKSIQYERAYGGASKDWAVVEARNWAGVGVAKSASDLDGTPAPQIEHPAHPHKTSGDKHPPMGYGAIMTHWAPRSTFGGTFDEVWRTTRLPLMPLDFDLRFNNVAHPSLFFEDPIEPGAPVSILGMHESGVLSFPMPRLPIVFRARFDQSGRVSALAPIDTLIIEPNRRRFEVLARKAFPMGRGKDVLREVAVDLA
jgi:hypothetical protein